MATIAGQSVKVGATLINLPKFSAVITSHNYENFVEQAIESVRAQTYTNFECLIVDDQSTDNSVQKIKKALARIKDNRFRLVALEKNVGQLAAMKIAVSQLTGVFVGFLDADDLWAPNFIRSHVMAHLGTEQANSFSCSDLGVISSDGRLLASTWHQLAKPRGIRSDATQSSAVTPLNDISELVGASKGASKGTPKGVSNGEILYAQHGSAAGWFFTPTSGCVFRKAMLDVIMPEDVETFRISADYYLVMFSSLLSGALILTRPLGFYRVHGENNFTKHPYLGSSFQPGPWDSPIPYNKAILRHIDANFDRFAALFGGWRCADLTRKLVPVHQRYTMLSGLERLRREVHPMSKSLFFLVYGIYYRWKK